ncbi:hypothetical protein QCA50_005309 [Cerrena zonata]|uniref:Uncharacterized protein n=1 Tax=Cerrena zonata TaxID=2478898 RepID=A0AAW0GJE6_9APHY
MCPLLNNTTALLSTTKNPSSWEAEPKSRGTFNILSICLSTIFICVWKAYHPDMPKKMPEHRRWFESLWEFAVRFVFFFLLPEGLFALALQELRAACISYYNVKQLDACPPIPASWYSKWFQKWIPTARHSEPPSRLHHWTMTHAFYTVMGGYAVVTDDPIVGSTPSYRVLEWTEVLEILEHEPSRVPDISEEHILARSQSDTLSKLIALAQIFSFCMTCILRRAEGLSLSILEISTVAYAVCAILVYIVWWKKPHIITEPTLIEKERTQTNEGDSAPETLVSEGHNDDASRRKADAGQKKIIKGLDANKYSIPTGVIMCSSPTLYGLLHLLAWNEPFPSSSEGILWRISTVVVTMSCIPLLLLDHTYVFERWWSPRVVAKLQMGILCVFLLTYVPARLFMIAEAFRQLLYLPPDAYQIASWSKYLPQFS